MAKTYAQIQEQIEKLKAQADEARRREAAKVIVEVKKTIQAYGLTAQDLGLDASAPKAAAPKATAVAVKRARKGSAPKAAGAKKARRASVKAATKAIGTVKYRHPDGSSWSGRGPAPRWLKAELAAGKTLNQFLVSASAPASAPAVAAVPASPVTA